MVTERATRSLNQVIKKQYKEKLTMKKLLILILTLVMAFSLASCKSKCEKNGHIDEDANGVCDRCDEVIKKADGEDHLVHNDANNDGYCDGCNSLVLNYDMPDAVAKVLKNSLEKQISATNSFKVELDLTVENSKERWTEDDGEPISYGDSETRATHVDITVSRTDAFLNAMVVVSKTLTYSDFYGDDVYDDTTEESSTYYFIDGVWYIEASEEVYIAKSLEELDITALLEKLSEVQLISVEDREALLAELGTKLVKVINLKDGKGSVSLDLKDDFDSFKEYFVALDLETTTLGMLFDDALALVDPELKATDIIDVIERVGGMTIPEAYAEINAWLTEEYDTTVQGIYDTVVNNPEVEELIRYIIIENNGFETDNDEEMQEVDDVIDTVKSFSIDDFIAQEHLAELTVYDFITSFEMLPFEFPETLEDLVAGLRAVLDVTLASVDENTERYIFESIQTQLGYITVNEFGGKLDFNFTSILELDSIDGAFKIDIRRDSPSDECEGKSDFVAIKVSVGLKIYGFSKDTVEIALAHGGVIDNDLLGHSYGDNFDGFYTVLLIGNYYYYDDQTVVDIWLSISLSDGTWIDICYEYVPIEYLLDEDIVLPSDYVTCINNSDLIVDSDSTLVMKRISSNDITVLSVPELKEPPFLQAAIDSYINGSNVYGITMDAVITEIYSYSYGYDIYFNSEYGILSIDVTVEYDAAREVFICTIFGLSVDSQHTLYRLDGIGFYGYTDDPELIDAYFDGDPTFELYYDEDTNSILMREYPEINEKYRRNW